MTKADQRRLFMQLRDMCKEPEFQKVGNHTFSKKDESHKIYEVLEKTGNLDVEYADHLGDRDGYELAAHPENLTFTECCTVLTFLLRAGHFSEGAFEESLADGSVYKVLSRAVETM